MSTLILKEAKALDLSRLSLIRYSSTLHRVPNSSEILTRAKIVPTSLSNAGKHHVVTIELFENEREPFAFTQFEIIDRKRGLKTAILHNLWEPKTRIDPLIEPKTVSLGSIFEKFSHLGNLEIGEEKWPFEALLAVPFMQDGAKQGLNIQTNLCIFGSANSQMPCQIFESKGLGTNPDLIEIFQENVLIAQLN